MLAKPRHVNGDRLKRAQGGAPRRLNLPIHVQFQGLGHGVFEIDSAG
jgi:hypothetical protein